MDEPATYSSVVAVASVENALLRNAFTVNGKDIGYQRARGLNGEKVAFFSDLPAGTYEYVDAGFASEETRPPSRPSIRTASPARSRSSLAAT